MSSSKWQLGFEVIQVERWRPIPEDHEASAEGPYSIREVRYALLTRIAEQLCSLWTRAENDPTHRQAVQLTVVLLPANVAYGKDVVDEQKN